MRNKQISSKSFDYIENTSAALEAAEHQSDDGRTIFVEEAYKFS